MSVLPQIQYINGNGKPRLMVVLATALFTSGTGTTFTSTGLTVNENLTGYALAGRRVRSFQANAGFADKAVYAKITSCSFGASTALTVDSWVGGTPTDGKIFTIDGYVCDLPFCGAGGLHEIFGPDYLLHALWRQEKGTKTESEFHGWKYECQLHYEQYLQPDVLVTLKPALSVGANDALVLVPHVDFSGFNYTVVYAGQVDLSRYGRTAGYRGVVFAFQGCENLASWPIIDGYGTAFATNYGTCL